MTSENHVNSGTYVNGCLMHTFIGYPYDDVGQFDGVGVFLKGKDVVTAHYRFGATSWWHGNYYQWGAGKRFETREDAIIFAIEDAISRAGVGGEDD